MMFKKKETKKVVIQLDPQFKGEMFNVQYAFERMYGFENVTIIVVPKGAITVHEDEV